MSAFDKIKNLLFTDNDDSDVDDEIIDERNPYDTDEFTPPAANHAFERTQVGGAEEIETSKVNMTSGTSIEMKVIRPEKLDNSVTQIADYLINKNTVLLNLEATNKETARRLLDFLNGVAYAVNGKLKKVANSTFVITPSNVSISGENIAETSDHEAI
ncbi:MAG: cell division protein SepF [Ruminococcaceae bacterium]|nr:cell division protein SepF [Oscillospiraceae bacterium]